MIFIDLISIKPGKVEFSLQILFIFSLHLHYGRVRQNNKTLQ